MGHEAQVDMAEKQGQAIAEANALQQMDLARQRDQQLAQATDQTNEAHRQALADMATLDAIAGEFGGGNTANRGRAVLGVQQGETLATIGTNALNGLTETAFASRAAYRNASSQIRSIRAPSQLEGLLTIGSAALSSYNNYQTNQKLDKLASEGKTVK